MANIISGDNLSLAYEAFKVASGKTCNLMRGTGWVDRDMRINVDIGSGVTQFLETMRSFWAVHNLAESHNMPRWNQGRVYVDVTAVDLDKLTTNITPEERQSSIEILDNIIGKMERVREVLVKPISLESDPSLSKNLAIYKAKQATIQPDEHILFLDTKLETCGGAITELDTYTALILSRWVGTDSKDALIYQTSGLDAYDSYLVGLKEMRHSLGNSKEPITNSKQTSMKAETVETFEYFCSNAAAYFIEFGKPTIEGKDAMQAEIKTAGALIQGHQSLLQKGLQEALVEQAKTQLATQKGRQ